ncbi:hypothetical protein H4Q26_015366 [Puccinia striiformis f. sp. tritici PST-130]|uniref:Uncharacterized protein n=1 Tax=Puccinia striiformis f. sp. tritici PST-78 TaxID=1165861 RepID=A0A0L0VH16_9BASI|nr:hypothetical protein H4Q26_015366 [Puccinia striiformis f. sp. tritici PST-130]KNE98543.1 hypothetical protein PSTG_08282 [Puccinia striiformis f. sp. tritici PST-78]
MTPKEFMFHFVSSENSKITYLRRYWSTNTGVKVRALCEEIKETPLGRSLWKDLIQEEAMKIIIKEEPIRGDFTRTEASKAQQLSQRNSLLSRQLSIMIA